VLPVFDNVDVYPLLTRLIGVKGDKGDGVAGTGEGGAALGLGGATVKASADPSQAGLLRNVSVR
jgi:hypothetical protein